MLAFAATMLLITLSAQAEAKPLRPIGAGLGADLSFMHAEGYQTDRQAVISPDLSFSLDFLYALSVELSYKPIVAESEIDDKLVLDARFRLSAKAYVVPTEDASVFLKAGVGQMNLGRIFDFGGPEGSYHVGLGTEIYLDDRFAIGGEFLVLLPSEENTVDALASALVQADAPPPEVGDFVSATNFKVSLGLRCFF